MAPDQAPPAAGGAADGLTIERILAVDPGREYRVDPRERFVAFTREAGGARQLFLMPLRGGPTVQLSASEKPVSDPQWSPDGRRLAFVRDGAIWVVEADGSRQVRVTEHPAGNSKPRWSPDGRRLAFTVPPPGLVAGLADRRADPAPGPAGQQSEGARAGRRHAGGRRHRRVRLGARRQPAGDRLPARIGRLAHDGLGPRRSPPAPRRGSRPAAPRSAGRAGCPTARCSCSRTPTAGSRSSGVRPGPRHADGPHEGRPGARRAERDVRADAAALARRPPVQPHRRPRRPGRPGRRAARRRSGPGDPALAGRLAGDRLAGRRLADRGDRRERAPPPGPLAPARPRRRRGAGAPRGP